MKILFLTFYFEPDLSAGSFRNTSLAKKLAEDLKDRDIVVHVITTQPNRYKTYKVSAESYESIDNLIIHRIPLPTHNSGLIDQAKVFKIYYNNVLRISRTQKYDLVFASSARLFTAFLGAKIANHKSIPLFLDIRDLFRDTIIELLPNLISKPLNIILNRVEKYTFNSASHINLVSEGFKDYFKDYDIPFSYYPNGIDDIFLREAESGNGQKKGDSSIKTILYAGNIGEGQGLHHIIPYAAKQLEGKYKFVIIGGGGAIDKLRSKLESSRCSNVELIDPVSRKELITLYLKADYLFLHLNKLKAFEKVLPSKIFEYSAFDIPIIGGVSGFAARFMHKYVKNSILFSPGNVKEMILGLESHIYKREYRGEFITEFKRSIIMGSMSQCIIELLMSSEKRINSAELPPTSSSKIQ